MNPQFLVVVATNLDYTVETLKTITYTNDYWIFLAPLIFHIADVITGWVQATINNRWESTKMRYGIMRKASMMLIIAVAYSLEYAIEAVHQTHAATVLSILILAMEAISIFENLDAAGIPIPNFIRKRLKKAKKQMEEYEEDDLVQGKEE